jgi:hypothetical protein
MSEDNTHDALTPYRLTMIERTLETVSDNLKQLTQLEIRHSETREALARAFDELASQGKRIKDVELEMPTLRLTRGWIIAGVIGIVALVGLAAVRLILIVPVK